MVPVRAKGKNNLDEIWEINFSFGIGVSQCINFWPDFRNGWSGSDQSCVSSVNDSVREELVL